MSPRQAEVLRADPATLFVDVREADEWDRGHIPGAVLVPKSHLEQEIEAAVADRERPLVLYCAGGVRSVFAAQTLHEMGYAVGRLDVRRIRPNGAPLACRPSCHPA